MSGTRPTLEEVRALADQGNLVPVYRELTADLETPVSAFLKVARGPGSFLLESVEGGERLGRYSFIGTEPHQVLKAAPDGEPDEGDPLERLRQELARYRPVRVEGLPPFHGGAVGYLGYEMARHFERLPSPQADPLRLPRATFLFADTVMAFDHLLHKVKIVAHVHLPGGRRRPSDGQVEAAYREAVSRIDEWQARLEGPLPAGVARPLHAGGAPYPGGPVTSNMSREQYETMVSRAREYIVAGEVIQVVLSQRFGRPTRAAPLDIYRALRSINPSPYMFYLHLEDCHLVGSSPELLVRVRDGAIDYHPIAGTVRRGATPEEDQALEEQLRADEKERAEHVMLLDLGRNDVGRVSLPGSVKATQVMDVERYSHVMHLVSHVQGKLHPDLSAIDALRACFPAGTVSGAPKIRAMEIIAELEPDKRGPYAGCVGYFDFSGNLDTAITIRTIVLRDGVAYVQAGGGIVYDSLPEREFQETVNKAGALLQAIDLAEAVSR